MTKLGSCHRDCTTYGPQSLEYLLSNLLQKQLSNPWSGQKERGSEQVFAGACYGGPCRDGGGGGIREDSLEKDLRVSRKSGI